MVLQEASEESHQIVRPNDFVHHNQNMPGAKAIREALPRMVAGDWWDLYVLMVDDGNNDDDGGGESDTTTSSSNGGVDTVVSVTVVSLELGAVSDRDYAIPRGEYHECRVQLLETVAQKTVAGCLATSSSFPSTRQFHPFTGSPACNEQDLQYVEKIATRLWHDNPRYRSNPETLVTEVARLKRMLSKIMKPSLALWVRRRVDILQQFLQEDLRPCHLHFGPTPGLLYVYQSVTDCSAQEQEYVWQVLSWNQSTVETEILRLQQLLLESNNGERMEAALASWVRRRLWILIQIWRALSMTDIVAGTTNTCINLQENGGLVEDHKIKSRQPNTKMSHHGDEL